jgi:biotin transport system substrate-specific component
MEFLMNSQLDSKAMAMNVFGGSRSHSLAYYVLLVALGVVLMAISSKIKAPLWPNPTPVTMQTLVIFALSAAYGSRLAVATMLAYLASGAIGFPVFTGTPEKGIGIAYMVGATGGYLAAYPFAGFIVGKAADLGWSRNPFSIGAAMLAAETVVLVMGALWMGALFGADKILAWGVGPFVFTDLIKLALAACLVAVGWTLIPRPADSES